MATLKRMRSIGPPYFCRNTSNVEERGRGEEGREKKEMSAHQGQYKSGRIGLQDCLNAPLPREQKNGAGKGASGQYLQRAIISRLRSITETKYMFCAFARSLCYMCRRSSSGDANTSQCETLSFSLRALGNDTQL